MYRQATPLGAQVGLTGQERSSPEDSVWGLALSAAPSARLDALWANQRRRISHATALSRVVPLKAGVVVDASGPAVSEEAARRLGVNAYPESGLTMTTRARRVWRNTWLSLPDRALLECLSDGCGCNDAVRMAAGVMCDGLGPRPEHVRDTAGTLGFDDALRRLASIAAVLAASKDPRPSRGGSLLAASQSAYLDISVTDGAADWISVRPGNHVAAGSVTFRDTRQRVLWDDDIPRFTEDLLY